jgi:hypothetical protein
MSDAAYSARQWYDPSGWPRWVRWLLVGPVSLLAAVAIFFLYNIINAVASEVPTALTSLFAIAIGTYAFVGIGRVIAPAFSRLVGYVLATTALTLVGYYLGNIVVSGAQETPTWYAILVGLVAMCSAIAAAVTDIPDANPDEREVYAWMPSVLRWILFLPIALVLAGLACLALGVPLFFMHFSTDVVQLLNTPLAIATLIAVAAAVTPAWKNFVGVTIAALIAVVSFSQLLAGADRSLALQLIAALTHRRAQEFGWSMTPWYETLSGLSGLAGCVIGAIGAVQAEGRRKRVASQ